MRKGIVMSVSSWSRVRRAVARLLCWSLAVQSAPALAESVRLRQEPIGWPQVRAGAGAAARWAGDAGETVSGQVARSTAAAEDWAARVKDRGAELLAQTGATAAETRLALQLPPQSPPSPPGFSPSRLGQSGFVHITAAAGDVAVLPGWNLASIPYEPADPNPAGLFAPLGGAVQRVWVYDACDAADPWKLYDPADAAGSDLTSLDERQGFWLDATEAASLPGGGASAPAVTTIHLCAGWNLIGFPADQSRPVAAALLSIAGKYQRVFSYDPSDPLDPWTIYSVSRPSWANDLQLLEPGRGYWILATQDADLVIQNASDELAVDITSPAEQAEVTQPTPVVGTVSGSGLVSWTLRARAQAGGDWIVLTQSTTAVTAGTLGTFDPTLLENGLYELELRASDIRGEETIVTRTLLVEGQMKIGLFTLSFVDLEVPLAGIPIQIVRTYDSRLPSRVLSTDFGYGWSLEIRKGSYRNNRKPGLGWQFASGIVPCQFALEGLAHTTAIRLSDREIYRFRPRLTNGVPTQGGCFAQAGFAFVDGPTVGAALEIVGNTQVFWQNGTSQLLDSSSFEVYEPQEVRLRTRDGRSFDLSLTAGVTRGQDPNGNELQITAAGITHSSGRSIPFSRDGQGRITSVIDPEGKPIVYTYDAAGDLTSVTDREENTTTSTYTDHYLESIQDPRGITSLRNEYDASGRLIRHTDAFNKTIEFTHDLAANQEVITDRLGHSRTLEYDERGNVIRETDALGKLTQRTFDENDQVLTETDPLEHTTTYGYDANRNLTSVKDPLGNTTRYSHDAAGRVLTATDARGRMTTNSYDAAGNLLTTKDPLQNVTTYTYDARGNLETETNAENETTTYSYDGFGNLESETNALGLVTSNTYDANGNRLSQTTTRTTPTGVETLVTNYTYDDDGRLLTTEDPDHTVSRSVYDPLGNVVESYDKLLRKTAFRYDEMGRLYETLYADTTKEASAYDAEGRRESFTDRGERTTRYSYDAVGRLLTTTYPDNAVLTNHYDDAGRLDWTMDARTNKTYFAYDDAGRRTQVTDALNNETVFGYDENGNQTTVTDARRNTTTYRYDDAGRLDRVTFPDSSFTSTGYDKVGRRVSETDQASYTTQFGYDDLGRLTSVTDARGKVTRYGYDEQGNRTSQIDANNHETKSEYDSLGRQTKRILPGGASESFAYDAVGSSKTRRDFKGVLTEYTYDTNNRLLSRFYPDGSSVGFTYTATGKRKTAVDARGTTNYEYDARDRMTRLRYPDVRELRYAHDPEGNRTALTAIVAGQTLTTSYTYDAVSRLDTVTDPDGRVYVHTYDENGNRRSLSYPNGVRTTYDYDAVNRLTNLTTVTNVGGIVQSYAYTLGPSGNRTRVVELDGTARNYSYDELYRLTDEHVTLTDATRWRNTFVYDDVGNRLRQDRVEVGGGSLQVTYTYDDRDRLTTEDSLNYGWDENGNQISRSATGGASYTWDFESRLTRVQLANGTVVEHAYDADSTRVRTKTTSSGGAPVTTEYLIDPEHGTSTAGAGPVLSQVVAETEGAALVAYHLRGDDLLATIRPTAVRFFHADGLGSVRILTDADASVTDRYDFEAFGTLVTHTGEDSNAYLFAGQTLDPNSGFYYNRTRWMAPDIGRFAGMDRWSGDVFEPGTLHKYLYANANPVSNVDPNGETSFSDVMSSLRVIASTIGRFTAQALGRNGPIWRFFWNNRAFSSVSRAYWRRYGPAAGRSLHHWLFPQRATWIPQALRNAGFNLLEMPKILPGSLSLNTYLGFAVRWGGYRFLLAGFVENGIRFAVPIAAYHSFKGGYAAGEAIREFDLDTLDQEIEDAPDLLNPWIELADE